MFKKFILGVLIIGSIFTVSKIAISQVTSNTEQSKEDEASQDPKDDDLYAQVELFSYALSTVQSEYVDKQKAKDLIYGALKGMLGSLDPHSQFLNPDDYKELKTETQGKFGGLGIEISIRDGLLTIVTPLDDSQAWKVGLKAGDKIVKIEDDLTKDMTLNDAVKRLRGKPGTEVNITILREDELKIHEFTVVRDIIQIQDVKNTMILQDNIGYVRLAEFREDSGKEMRKALDELADLGATALVLDLRNNPGGLLNVAIDITEEFLPAGQTIVSTKGRRPSQNTITKSTNTTHLIEWPIVILINEGTASGSEILSGALKDNKRAVIVGEKSFGKGSVQSVIPLPDGSGLRVTTSKYFTPSGISIHGVGIEPDILVKFISPKAESTETEKEKNKIEKIFEDVKTKVPAKEEKTDENLNPKEKEKAETKKRLLEDNQVQSAISVLKGIRVYKTFGDS